MSKVLKEVTASIGQYTNAQGQVKNRYVRIGSIIETKSGPMLKLDQVPLKEGGWDGWAWLNEPKPREDMPPASSQRRNDFHDDDLPF